MENPTENHQQNPISYTENRFKEAYYSVRTDKELAAAMGIKPIIDLTIGDPNKLSPHDNEEGLGIKESPNMEIFFPIADMINGKIKNPPTEQFKNDLLDVAREIRDRVADQIPIILERKLAGNPIPHEHICSGIAEKLTKKYPTQIKRLEKYGFDRSRHKIISAICNNTIGRDSTAKEFPDDDLCTIAISNFSFTNAQSLSYAAVPGDQLAIDAVFDVAKSRDPETTLTKDNIAMVCGIGEAIEEISKITKAIIYVNPVYPAYSSPAIQRQKGFYVDRQPEKNWRIDMDELIDGIKDPRTNGVQIDNPDNPLGKIMERDDFEYMVKTLGKYGKFLLLDHAYVDRKLKGRQNELNTYIEEEICRKHKTALIRLWGESKSWNAPGLKAGCVEAHANGNPAMVQHMKSLIDNLRVKVGASKIPQLIINDILKHPDYPAYLERTNARLEEVINFLVDLYRTEASDIYENIYHPDGGLYITLPYRQEVIKSKLNLDADTERFLQQNQLRPDLQRILGQALSSKILSLALSGFYPPFHTNPVLGERITAFKKHEGAHRAKIAAIRNIIM